MICFDNLSKSFITNQEEVKALDQITFNIEKNESFGIIGESGAGKSTLLRMINGLETPSSGQVIVDDKDLTQLSEKELNRHRSKVWMIFQHYNLLNNKTVEDNIQLPLDIHSHEQALTVDEVLDFVGLLDKKTAYPSQLSGGQKQRVGIARALITKPKILLCDEPTSALDLSTTHDIVQVLDKVNREFDMTVVSVTHELDVIKRLCSRSALLQDGQLLHMIEVKNQQEEKGYDSYHARALEVLQS